MGFALAEGLVARGAQVILVCGPVILKTDHPSIHRIDVTSADEMYDACITHFDACDGAILTAAVADYAPVVIAADKIKRAEGNLLLELKPNKDIAAELGRRKRKDQLLVGFALETRDEIANALSKMNRKNLDMIVLNSLKEEGAGFGYDTNKITILTKDGQIFDFPLKSKIEVAVDIIDKIFLMDAKNLF